MINSIFYLSIAFIEVCRQLEWDVQFNEVVSYSLKKFWPMCRWLWVIAIFHWTVVVYHQLICCVANSFLVNAIPIVVKSNVWIYLDILQRFGSLNLLIVCNSLYYMLLGRQGCKNSLKMFHLKAFQNLTQHITDEELNKFIF